MKTVAAVATVVAAPAERRVDAVDALRSRLAGTTAREHVVLDFLSDDLREARDAMGAVEAYVEAVEKTLSDGRTSQERLMALAMGAGPSTSSSTCRPSSRACAVGLPRSPPGCSGREAARPVASRRAPGRERRRHGADVDLPDQRDREPPRVVSEPDVDLAGAPRRSGREVGARGLDVHPDRLEAACGRVDPLPAPRQLGRHAPEAPGGDEVEAEPLPRHEPRGAEVVEGGEDVERLTLPLEGLRALPVPPALVERDRVGGGVEADVERAAHPVLVSLLVVTLGLERSRVDPGEPDRGQPLHVGEGGGAPRPRLQRQDPAARHGAIDLHRELAGLHQHQLQVIGEELAGPEGGPLGKQRWQRTCRPRWGCDQA